MIEIKLKKRFDKKKRGSLIFSKSKKKKNEMFST